MKASDLLVKALEHEGVDRIFGVPGEENLDFLESLRASRIRLIVTRHEQAAGMMAATYGRLTGKPGVALSTLGPGATNCTTAAAYATLGGMPALFITGQKPIKTSKQGHFQIINAVELFRPITKYTKQIVSGASIPAIVREAYRTAREERPGAAHIELPEDIAREEVLDPHLFPIYAPRRPAADEKAVARAVEMIERSLRPLILVGAGANRKMISASLRAFVDKTGIPFFTTQMGKGVVDERHPLSLGTAALSADDYVHCAIERADLIINVGHDVVEKPPFLMRRGQAVIHINFFAPKVDDVYFPDWEVVGDIGNALWQMAERIRPSSGWDTDYARRIKAQTDAQIAERSDSTAFPLLPQRIVADVRRAMPDDGIVCLDNGMYKLWFARNYRAYAPNTILLDNALATMGAGLPSAIAAALAYPDKNVLAVCGDGGFLMSAAELETAVRLGAHIVVLIVNDGGYGMIQWKQRRMGLPDFGLSFGNPDFVRFAESFGARGYRVREAGDLLRLVTDAFAQPGVHVIDVPVDYAENARVFDRELKEKVCLL
jgi:acetolactate synthase-1/2/3 large subunit